MSLLGQGGNRRCSCGCSFSQGWEPWGARLPCVSQPVGRSTGSAVPALLQDGQAACLGERGRGLAVGPALLSPSAVLQVLPQGAAERAAGLGVHPLHQADAVLRAAVYVSLPGSGCCGAGGEDAGHGAL